HLPGRPGRVLLVGAPGQPGSGKDRPGSVHGQHGGQGGPVRHRPVGHVHHHHDLFHHRHRQQHARYPDASGRHDPLAAHDAERGLRRQGRRPDEHDYVRHPGSVHLRPDDWPYARIPGQEDRGPGDEAHRAVHHHP
ncbi:30S ribosomal protein S9, partial [Dysosmobacter welbionis]